MIYPPGGGGGWSVGLKILSPLVEPWSFLKPTLILQLFRGPPPPTSHIRIQKGTHHCRESKGLRRSYVRNQGPRPSTVTKGVPIHQEITRALRVLLGPGTRDEDQIHISFYFTISQVETEKQRRNICFSSIISSSFG